MRELRLLPDETSFAADFTGEVFSVRLDGGRSLAGQQVHGRTFLINAKWFASGDDYSYLMAFYRTATAKGAKSFLVKLRLRSSGLQRYKARFVPSTIVVTGDKGIDMAFSAQLQVLREPV